MAAGGNLVWRAGRSRVCAKKGAIEQLYTAPPAGSVVVCLDEMGPQASKSYPGQHLVRASAGERATQEIDYGRRVSPAMCLAPFSRPRERRLR